MNIFAKKKQNIILFEGADMVGKTEIAKELAKKLDIPYFKNTGEWKSFLDPKDYFVNTLRYAEPYFLSYLKQTEASVILDRSYPSEWVYSKAFGRETDDNALAAIDQKFHDLGAKIIICHRSTYKGIKDDRFPDKLGSEKLEEIDRLYDKFSAWTRCSVIRLLVDDEDLEREIKDIKLSLKALDVKKNKDVLEIDHSVTEDMLKKAVENFKKKKKLIDTDFGLCSVCGGERAAMYKHVDLIGSKKPPVIKGYYCKSCGLMYANIHFDRID